MLIDILIFVAGLALLVGGAWALVNGGSRIAELLGVAPVIVGLTIVAWGTSAPELCVSLIASLRDSPELMLGNVIGSNVANIGLVLGLAVLLIPVIPERRLARRDIWVLLTSIGLMVVFCWDRYLDQIEGSILLGLFVVYTVWILHQTASERTQHQRDSLAGKGGQIWLYSLMVVAGIAGLAGGGDLIVRSAVSIATALGASEALIGLSLVAIGTSLPELATTIVAALKRQHGMMAGNVVGSNLFNTLAVAGPVAIIRPVSGSGTLHIQLVGMIVLTLLLVPVLFVKGHRIPRLWGVCLLGGYSAVMFWWVTNGV